MTHGVNDTRFKDAMGEAREIARTHASGGRALAVLYGKIVHWAADGVIDTQKDKHGKGIDDVSMLYDEYAKAYVSRAGAGQTADSIKAQKSKMRLPAKVGEMTTLGLGGPKEQLDRLTQEYARQAEVDPKSVRPESAAILAWAKQQLDNSDNPLSDDALSACCAKAEKEDPTVAEYVEGVRRKLERLINGEAGVKCVEAPIVAAHESLRGFLQLVEKQAQHDEVLRKAAELGLTVVQEAAE